MSATASLQFLTNAEASTSASSSITASCLRFRLADASVSSTLTATSDSQLEANGVAQIDAVSTVSPTIVRVRFGDGSTVQAVSSFASAAIGKWEHIDPNAVTWTNVPVNSIDWNKLAA